MEMMQISALVEKLTDEQLVQELQQPSGMAPLQVIMGELQRRAGLRGGKPRGFARGGPVAAGSFDVEAEINRLFPALVNQESGGVNGRLGPMTRYGQAQGRTQMLPDTAREMAERIGVPWRPEMMTGASPEAGAYQDRLGREYLREGLTRTGNARDGLRYYHGGPDRGIWGRNTNSYADSILAAVNGGSAPPPPRAAGLDGSGGFSNPVNITNEALSSAQRLAEGLGIGNGLGTIQERFDDVSAMMPNATAPYDSVIARLQEEEGRERGANRGRSLIDAGMAMMAAPTPNFMSALAAGGQAGFASRDRIQAEERGLMQSVIQAQLARSQAEQQRDASVLTSATGLLEGDRRTLQGAYGLGSELALGGARSTDAAAQNRTQVEQAALERASKEREGALDRINRLETVREQALVQAQSDANPERVYQSILTSALANVGERRMVPGVGDKPPTMSVYTREDAIRDAREGTAAAMAYRAAMGTPSPAAPATGGTGGPTIVSVDGVPVSAPASTGAPAPAPVPAPARAAPPAPTAALVSRPAYGRPRTRADRLLEAEVERMEAARLAAIPQFSSAAPPPPAPYRRQHGQDTPRTTPRRPTPNFGR